MIGGGPVSGARQICSDSTIWDGTRPLDSLPR